jgi:glycosyltransferase involved in cell wall biosynthesis
MNNICIIIPAFMKGGVTAAITNLAIALSPWANIHIISFVKGNEISTFSNINIHYLYANNLSYKKQERMGTINNDAKNLIKFIIKIEKKYGNFNLFLSNTAWCDRVMAKCNLPKTHHIIHEATEKTWQNIGLFRAKKYRFWQWFRALKGRSVICVSEGIAEGIKKHKRIKPSQLQVIYNTFDINKIIMQKNEYTPNPPVKDYIIHVGRFCKEKRYDVLFSALKMLPDVTLVLLVKHPEKAIKLAKEYGISQQLNILDFQQNPFPWIAAAKLLVLSSDTEGLGMVLIESLICETPIVSTDCDYGPREILTGKLKEYLVPINDAQALADKISKALISYPDISNTEIVDKINPKKIALRYLDLCK